ncbi:LysR substrate-binding domain-containing protein [Aestuariivirga sp.]|uniref:LysR substrate-binding domain-containing protein n=1 Tax=Aestuariivirga sp. TaxID=2650926 RepID=UPI0039E49D24
MRHAQLKAFHAVAVHCGFSRAAERLALTQPAVSDHVRKLEEMYGVQLFNRTPKGVELTEIGRKLFTISERQFEAESEALELLSRARTLEEGQLTIGADAASHVLPQVARYRARHPGIAIRMVSGNSADLLDQLDAFTIDIAVTAERPSSEAIQSRLLRRDRLVAVTRREEKLPRALTLEKLSNLPLVLREDGSVTRRLLLDEFRARGLKAQSAIEIESREAVREAVAQGLGVAVMSEGELAPDARLNTVKIADWEAEMAEWLLCLKARAGLHVIRSFFDESPAQASGVHNT